MYLSPELNRDQIRAMYALVAKALLPIDGNLNALNAEYAQAMDAATRKEMGERSNASYEHQAATNERIRNVIEAVLRLGFEAEVLGWGHGQGRPPQRYAQDTGLCMEQQEGQVVLRWHPKPQPQGMGHGPHPRRARR